MTMEQYGKSRQKKEIILYTLCDHSRINTQVSNHTLSLFLKKLY